ncbi:PIG-L deacetylase family protein [Nocardioides panaciterrulae]|uniref:LmbE family N-acetylglucosaminyl deacetylase n=1 Tax=Nocardioides panaciterrulae TaxID=661492 RepID=A0A7Y9E8B4_9ACTN|nr:PIG-L deacetylase family protein [Nocardioides panaciterrulae]NYD43084.1 LmbE family N-acetylglucosaminyl deacetylase [Nocardioides panaciterrulae]
MDALRLPDGPLHVLCVGAHPDDIEIGCGGTLLRLTERAELELTVAVLTGTPDRVAESTGALEEICPEVTTHFAALPDGRLPTHWEAAKEHLEDIARRCRPQLVLTHRVDDAHQDHRTLGVMVTTVWRDALVLHFEIPKWDGDMGTPSHYVGLTREQAQRKVSLLKRHFPSQHPHDWWDEEVFLGLMRLRGMECRRPYAEAFHVAKALVEV